MWKSLITWWEGVTLGAQVTVAKRGKFVAEDEFGNRYYQATKIIDGDAGRLRRWVLYKGYADASKVPPDWRGWLQHTYDEPPSEVPLKRRAWELEHQPNLTGSIYAWKPKGAISRGGERAKATGDYEAWSPE